MTYYEIALILLLDYMRLNKLIIILFASIIVLKAILNIFPRITMPKIIK